MILIQILMFFIAITESVRLFSLFNKRSKKSYFKQRLDGIEQSIYDTEFQRYKTKEMNEELRLEMVALKSKQEILREEIQKEEKLGKMDKGNIARMKDEDERMEVKINKLIYGIGRPKYKEDKTIDEELTAQIPKEIDLCIKGLQQQLQFLNEKIDSYQALKVMVQDFMKKEL